MRSVTLVTALILTVAASSQINIIPQPASLKTLPGEFTFTSTTNIVYEDQGLALSAQFLQTYLQKYYKLNLKLSSGPSSASSIVLSLKPAMENVEGKPTHNYSLNIQQKSCRLDGTSPEAVFNGVQTIIQLLPLKSGAIKIPCLQIEDEPRFEYRGLHLDVGRHFMPVDFIKKYIDYIALHKMNYFHWHLTEDQGWRIEIKKYPKLISVAAWRNGTIIGRYPGNGNDNIKHGGFYTQEQVKEIVKYAADRYITVVPEIELPGHSSAAIAAYPFLSCFPEEPTKIPANMISKASATVKGKLVQETWGVFEDVFCAGKDETFNFLQDVMDEVMALFPSKMIHVGGDECPKANWKRCPNCQKRMKDKKLKDEHELQSYFIQRMEKYLNSKGRTLIGWDEILEGGLAPKAIVMSWRGEDGGIAAAKENHQVIMTPGSHVYLDHSQSENEDSVTIGGFTTVDKIYSYEPIPAVLTEEQGKYVLGAQGNVWTEYMENQRKIEYMIFPRLSALSEVLWSPKEKRNWPDFEKRLQPQFKRYELWRANYSKAYFDLKATVLPAPNNDGLLWKLETKQPSAEIKYITHAAGQTRELTFAEGKVYSSPVEIKSSGLIAAISMIDRKPVSNPVHATFLFNKATGKKISLTKEPSKNYPGDGAFTLINGIQNEMGRVRSKEFLGFSGDDCEATIDFGKEQAFTSVTVHTFRQEGAWIYQPLTTEVFVSADGKSFSSVGLTDDFIESRNGNGTMKVQCNTIPVRYVKVVIKNWGVIPSGKPGAGNKAWLFVDEIEVN
jgi:hexosaminidase